ncbi:MAG: amidohydrolase [Acidobacteriota bacterium]|nr:amidohydrolase [Acidobacteriota bacterium]MDH3522801.1 amidohydrolase [Acidobacteriota bacterium]
MSRRRPLLLLPALALGCASPEPAPRPDVVYHGGSIWTGVPGGSRAQALAVRDGFLVAVGSDAEVLALAAEETRRIDLAGAFVAPGLIDNHTHFIAGGFGLAGVQLRDAATPAELSSRIAEFAATVPAGGWILNGDWDHELWGGELPRRDWIDEHTPETPVFVTRLDGHMALANSKAMALAGVTPETASPAGGEIVRDAGGRPTGVFKDAAMALIAAAIPPRSEAELDRALAAAQRHALVAGVTQIHDMSDGEWSSLATFRRARAADRLALRVYSFVPLEDWRRMAAYVEAHGRGDARLRWGGVKGFVDGSLGSTTAWFYEPYADAPGTRGFPLGDLEELASRIAGADAAGLHVAVHAIGDRANDWLLETFARVGGDATAGRRFRVEHAQHLSAAAIARFAALGVVASMQPYHAIDDGRWAEKRIGGDRIRTTYAFADLLAAGARVTFGSDWTVAPIEPLLGIYAAVTRRTTDGAHPGGWVPEQKVTVEQALRAYTAANAYAGFQEESLGTLEAGKLADFVVLSRDLLAVDPASIPEVRVLRTVVGGATVYEEP